MEDKDTTNVLGDMSGVIQIRKLIKMQMRNVGGTRLFKIWLPHGILCFQKVLAPDLEWN